MILTGSNVAKALISAFGSPEAAAAAVGCDRTAIWRWMTKKSVPQRRHIAKARNAIEKRAEELRAIADQMRV